MIEGIIETQLKIIPSEDGNVLHGIRSTDKSFVGFEEAYFSFINKDHVKAWKCHKKMTLNLIVPVGKVKFVFYSSREDLFRVIEIGEKQYSRLTVPPKIWFGFKGIGKPESIIMSLANMQHDPKEVLRCKKNSIKFNW